MPNEAKGLGSQARIFVDQYVGTGDKRYAAVMAGYASPDKRASQALATPAVQAEIRRTQLVRMQNLASLALDLFEKVLQDDTEPTKNRIAVGKIVVDKALGAEANDLSAKEPHQMTAEELEQAIDRLRGQLEQRSDQAKDVTPVTPVTPAKPDPGMFD